MSTAKFFFYCKYALYVESISCVTVRSVVMFVDSVLYVSDVVPTSDEDATAIVVLFISSGTVGCHNNGHESGNWTWGWSA